MSTGAQSILTLASSSRCSANTSACPWYRSRMAWLMPVSVVAALRAGGGARERVAPTTARPPSVGGPPHLSSTAFFTTTPPARLASCEMKKSDMASTQAINRAGVQYVPCPARKQARTMQGCALARWGGGRHKQRDGAVWR